MNMNERNKRNWMIGSVDKWMEDFVAALPSIHQWESACV